MPSLKAPPPYGDINPVRTRLLMMGRFLPVLLIPLLLLSGCFLLPKEEEMLAPPLMQPPEITYEWYETKRASIVDDFRVSGNFVYAKQENVYFRYRGGRLLKIYVNYADQVKSGQLLAELDTDNLKYQVVMQDLALQKARLQAERATLLGQDRIQQQMAALDVKQAEITLDSYRTELSKAQLFSPLDGVVVYLGRFAEGDPIDSYRTVVRIADPRVIELSYQGIKSSDFTFGINVEVTYDGKTYAGTVVRTPGNAPIDTPEAERSLIIVRVKNLPAAIQAGDNATIRVIMQQRDNVIVIPRNLVQTYQGSDFVNILQDNIKKQQPVEKGIVSATEAEIVKGLKEGDRVIVR
jgi:RND family efflux transporter MFP subunit